MSVLSAEEVAACTDLLAFIDASPTPFHAVENAVLRLSAAAFAPLDAKKPWSGFGPGKYLVTAGDSALFAFAISKAAHKRGVAGFRIVGAHTDSPNLRLKPRAVFAKAGYVQLGVEVYGGALLNSWLDRDLYLAGRVVVRSAFEGRLESRLVRLREPLLRIAQLAIHLDREVNEKGLALNRQDHMAPILGLEALLPSGAARDDLLRNVCANKLEVNADSIVTTELMLADAVPSARGGVDGELLYAPRLDNLAMCHAALNGLLQACAAQFDNTESALIPVVALFDHEEVGSGSAYGAQSHTLPAILERIVLGLGGTRADYLHALAGSLCVSADMAHAVHPNYLERHDPHHRPLLNGGPVIKTNAQQRYATCARTAALFLELCQKEEVPVQHYVHRTDLPCGSTIGPITATLLGIPTVDVGNSMLSMHSVRELGGVHDPARMIRVLSRFFFSAAVV